MESPCDLSLLLSKERDTGVFCGLAANSEFFSQNLRASRKDSVLLSLAFDIRKLVLLLPCPLSSARSLELRKERFPGNVE